MVVEKMGMGLQPIKINYFWNIKMNNNEQNNCIVNGDMENTISETCSYNGICLCTGYCQCKKKYATYPGIETYY